MIRAVCQAAPVRIPRRPSRCLALLVVAASLAVVALTAATPVGAAPTTTTTSTSTTKASTKWPDLVGTWTGRYRFPSSTNKGVDSTETLIIDTQDGELLWGYNQFVEADGTITKIPLRGSIDFDTKGFGLAETGGFFVGRITGKRSLTIRFFLVADKFTSFDAKLTRAAR